jgi:hypothetical protein
MCVCTRDSCTIIADSTVRQPGKYPDHSVEVQLAQDRLDGAFDGVAVHLVRVP